MGLRTGVHVRLTKDELKRVDAVVAKNPRVLNRSLVIRGSMEIALPRIEKDPSCLIEGERPKAASAAS